MGSWVVTVRKSVGEFLYTPSIVTSPLYIFTCFRDIAAFVQNAIFPTHLYSPQISPCSPGNRWIAFSLQRAKVLG